PYTPLFRSRSRRAGRTPVDQFPLQPIGPAAIVHGIRLKLEAHRRQAPGVPRLPGGECQRRRQFVVELPVPGPVVVACGAPVAALAGDGQFGRDGEADGLALVTETGTSRRAARLQRGPVGFTIEFGL